MEARNKTDLNQIRYTVVHRLVDPLVASSWMPEVARELHDHYRMKVKKLYDFVESTFSGEENLEKEGGKVHCNIIVKSTMSSVNGDSFDKNGARQTFTNELVTNYLER